MAKKAQFATKIGLVAATVGSAIRLGNVWRFPAETQENGGAAFLLLYVVCVLLLGIPVMLGEMSLGRGGRSDAVGVFKRLTPGSKWWIIGGLAILAAYLITVFYMVVAGWTLEYLCESVTGALYTRPAPDVAPDRAQYLEAMNSLIYGWWQPVVATVVVVLLNMVILLRGVQKGIEKLSNVLMPVLFVVLVCLVVVSLTLPDARSGVMYFLSPDFSKITPAVFVNALGQTFFSLSLGMGILVTYASYYPKNTDLPRTSMIVAFTSLFVAVLVGLIIFPAVKSFGLEKEGLEGATLIFVTLPEVFGRISYSPLWSSLFFVLLLVAAITSTVSISEVAIAFLIDRFGMKRRNAVLTTLLPLLVLSPLCSLSLGPLKGFTLFGMTIFDFLDNFATNILLPIVSIGTCLYVGWFGPKRLLDWQLTNYETKWSPYTAPVLFVLRYVAPVLIVAILVSRFL